MTAKRKPANPPEAASDGARADVPTAQGEHPDPPLPPADAVTAFRIVGTKLADIPLPPDQRLFTLGSGDDPKIDVRISSKMAHGEQVDEHVSRAHLDIERKGRQLWIHDRSSTNGTFINGRSASEGFIGPGDLVRVGTDVTLLVMDDQMRRLRPTLRWVLGFDAHAKVDKTLAAIHAGPPVLLLGPPACEQRLLAEQIHATSARRARGFVAVTAPLPERDHLGDIATASHGTLYVNLADFKKVVPAWFVDYLFDPTYQVRPIVAAPTPEFASKHLGDRAMPSFEVIEIPPIADRRADAPGILDSLFRRLSAESKIEVAQLGDARVRRLAAFAWPDNFDDLRRNAPRVLAYIESGFNESAAARSLGITRQSLADSLRRIGL